MSLDTSLIIAAIINFILFLLHVKVYKKSRSKFRSTWASGTFGAGIGFCFARLPAWIYGISKDYTTLWTAVVIWGTAIIMFYINYKIK